MINTSKSDVYFPPTPHVLVSIPNRLFRMWIEKEMEHETDKTLIRLYQLIIDAINIFSKSDSWWQRKKRILLYIKWQQCKFNIHGYIVLNFLPDFGEKLLICNGLNALFSLAQNRLNSLFMQISNIQRWPWADIWR